MRQFNKTNVYIYVVSLCVMIDRPIVLPSGINNKIYLCQSIAIIR